MTDKRRAAISADRLLGVVRGDEPTTREVVERVEMGDPEGAVGDAVDRYLRTNPDVARAIRAGLDEARRLESALAAMGGPIDLGQRRPEYDAALAIKIPALRAAAATRADPSPFPEDHRVLVDERGLRISYFRRGGEAFVGVFTRDPNQARLTDCLVGDRRLPAAEGVSEATIQLGPPAQLAGKQLVLGLEIEGQQVTLRLTVVAKGATA